jgi:hypothetical protein
MTTHIITVATHKEGKLQELIDNKFNYNISVLGMGQKWTGFKMKFELVLEYINNLQDDDIVIFLDGFDSEIKLEPHLAVEIFKKNNYKILFSYEPGSNFLKLDRWVWPSCKKNEPLNTGIYMGYVKYLKIFLTECLKAKCKDDQVIANSLCKKLEFMEVDKHEQIFQNLKLANDFNYNGQAIFVSYPGSFSFKRAYRFIFEYIQFVLLPLFILYLLVVYFLLKLKKKKYIYISSFSFLLLLILLKADYSCINYSWGLKKFFTQ